MSGITTLTSRAIDFTSKDFESWLVDMQIQAQAVFPNWTDYNKANIGNLMLELFAHTLDVMTYSIDRQTNESFIPTARLRRSMSYFGKLVGYNLLGASEASVDLEFTIADSQVRAVDIVIPAGTQVVAPDIENPQDFYTTSEARIVQGTLQVSNVAARNAAPQSESFTTDGSLNQQYSLTKTPYLDGSAQIIVGTDVYTLVTNILLYGPTDKVFTVIVDENNVGTIVFGDGVNGYPPSGFASVDYETGGGSSGNVEANAINEITDPIQDTLGNIVQLVVRNPSYASGGTNQMSVEEARVAIPEHVLTTGNRTITDSDFEINARRVRGVARSLVLTHDDDTSIPEYTAYVYIVPVGGGMPSVALRNEVLVELTETRPQPVGMDVYVLQPTLKIISISAKVYLDNGAIESVVRQNIEDSLDSFFALTDSDGNPNLLVDFGFHIKNWQGTVAGEVPWSDIFNAVNDAAGVRKVDKVSFSPASDQILANKEFPVLGSITLINGDTNLSF